jgi:uncharacterized DUF497 family protein
MNRLIYGYNPQKNSKLLEERGINFEDVIVVLENKRAITVLDHPNKIKYPQQKIYVIEISGYMVPFEPQGNKAVLKTIYPSRKITRLYKDKLQRGVRYEQTKM